MANNGTDNKESPMQDDDKAKKLIVELAALVKADQVKSISGCDHTSARQAASLLKALTKYTMHKFGTGCGASEWLD